MNQAAIEEGEVPKVKLTVFFFLLFFFFFFFFVFFSPFFSLVFKSLFLNKTHLLLSFDSFP